MPALGLIGCGTMAGRYHLPVIRESFRYSKLLLHDTNRERMEQLASTFDAGAASLQEICNSCDHIIIASPPSTHYSLLKQCMAPGRIILCEKPFLYRSTEMQEILELAEARNCQVFAGHLRRLFPQVQLARKLIANRHMGKLLGVRMHEGGRFTYKASSDYLTADAYGGVLPDTGSHLLDSMLFITQLDKQALEIKIQQIEKEPEGPGHSMYARCSLNDIKTELRLSRYELLANKISLDYEEGSVDIPTDIRPFIRFKPKGKQAELIPIEGPLPDFRSLLKQELEEVFFKQNHALFGAALFVQLTSLLETLDKNTA